MKPQTTDEIFEYATTELYGVQLVDNTSKEGDIVREEIEEIFKTIITMMLEKDK